MKNEKKIYYLAWNNARHCYIRHDKLAEFAKKEVKDLRKRINGLQGGCYGFKDEIERLKKKLRRFLDLYREQKEKRALSAQACKFFKDRYKEKEREIY